MTFARNLIFCVIVIPVILCATGCAASSHVLVGTTRPPISPDQVKLYLRPPAKYEEVAVIDASSRSSMAITDQGKMNKAIERLRTEAAKLGANGVSLAGTGDQAAGSVGTGFGTATANGGTAFGTGVAVNSNIYIKAARGIAIYVSQE